MSHSQSAGQQLSASDLLVVTEQLNDIHAKWYDIGLQLHVSVVHWMPSRNSMMTPHIV